MYLRAVKPAKWEALVDGAGGAIDACAAEMMRGGALVSVYECSSVADVELAAVAISATRRRQKFHFIAITSDDLATVAVAPIRSAGKTLLPAANQLHRDLDLAAGRAQALVALLQARSVAVEVVREEQLRVAAAMLRAAGQPIPAGAWLLR